MSICLNVYLLICLCAYAANVVCLCARIMPVRQSGQQIANIYMRAVVEFEAVCVLSGNCHKLLPHRNTALDMGDVRRRCQAASVATSACIPRCGTRCLISGQRVPTIVVVTITVTITVVIMYYYAHNRYYVLCTVAH